MANQYIVVDATRSTYYFDEESFYNFVNEVDEEDDDDKMEYIFLDQFPLPDDNSSLDDDDDKDYGRDEDGRPMGNYCPFSNLWPSNALFVLKNGATFVPGKKQATKTITITEYCEPAPKPKRTRTPAQKQARRRR
jgi:hypothetical protein